MNLCRVLFLAVAIASPAAAQSVQQSGTVTRGHVAVWNTSGVIADGGSSASSPISSIGVTNNGSCGIGINSALLTSAAWQQLCFGVTTAGVATISLQNFGTAPVGSFQFVVNGAAQGFPTVSPLPVVVGDLACFGATSGGLTDCGTFPASTVLGSISGGTPASLTQTQLTSLINLATASLSGALPPFPNNTTTYLRGDLSYAALNVGAIGGFGTGVAAALGVPVNTASGGILVGPTLPSGLTIPSPTVTGTLTGSTAILSGTAGAEGTALQITGLSLVQAEVGANVPAIADFQRTANFTGGTAGFEGTSIRSVTTTTAGDNNFEDAGLFILNNNATSSTGSENSGIHVQSNALSTGGTWILTLENIDHTTNANPTAPHIGIENAFRVNGTDTNSQRSIYDAICTRFNDTGAQATCGFGMRITAGADDPSEGNGFTTGLAFGVSGVTTNFVNGIDFTNGTFSNVAMLLTDGQKINFHGAAGDRELFYFGGLLAYNNGSVNLFQVDDSGNFTAFGSISSSGVTDSTLTTAGVVTNTSAGLLGTTTTPTLNAVIAGGAHPTLSGTCAAGTQVGGNTAGTFKASAACTAGTVILTFATTAPNGWVCGAHDQTTPADAMNQTANTATSCTLTGTMASADVVVFDARAF